MNQPSVLFYIGIEFLQITLLQFVQLDFTDAGDDMLIKWKAFSKKIPDCIPEPLAYSERRLIGFQKLLIKGNDYGIHICRSCQKTEKYSNTAEPSLLQITDMRITI